MRTELINSKNKIRIYHSYMSIIINKKNIVKNDKVAGVNRIITDMFVIAFSDKSIPVILPRSNNHLTI